VGIGLGTTLARLTDMGYAADGITPDRGGAGSVRRADPRPHVAAGALRDGEPLRRRVLPGVVAVHRERSAFSQGRALATPGARVVVLDEFALAPVEKPGALHRLDCFLEAAGREGFRLREDLDVSRQAVPTIDWFLERIPKHWAVFKGRLGVKSGQVDTLLESGRDYRALYASGAYG
jgi:hypothetical protein